MVLAALTTLSTLIVAAGSTGSAAVPLKAAAERASVRASLAHTVNMANVPKAAAQAVAGRAHPVPFLTGVSPAVYAKRKAAAAHQKLRQTSLPVGTAPSAAATNTPSATNVFNGMADSASICPYFGGCQPPDQAIAASSKFVLQGVNTSFAVYSPSGVLQSGFPKTAQAFFGVPNPGTCDPHGPFLSDPRAFYDPIGKRFWVAELQVEGAFGLNSCPFLTRYWVAVSSTSNPTGSWHVYAFDMSLGTTNAADYTQFGFNGQAVFFGGNMFNQAGTAYAYDEIFGVNKAAMMAGSGVTAFGFFNLTVGGTPVDTVQPVLAESPGSGPRTGLFINSFNIDFGGGQCSGGCSGLTVWSMANPGTSSTSLSGLVIGSNGYSLAPNADEPGCTQCIETLDTRISGTPVYHDGLISYALETAINNGSQIVPGIYWGQVLVRLTDAAAITSGTGVFQQGYYFYGGDGAASFPALMADEEGNLFMVFEFMNSSINPESAYVSRRVTFTSGSFHDNGLVLRSGLARTTNSRWGDYEAAAYDGFSTNHVWIAGEHSGSNGDWATGIGRLQLGIANP